MNNISKTGTTVFAFKFKDGILVAGDTQSTLGNFKSDVLSKIHQITKDIVMCAAGCAGDMLNIAKILIYKANEYKSVTHTDISCTALANILSNILSRRSFEVGVILSGYDFRQPKIYVFDGIGYFDEQSIACYGSGSQFARGKLADVTHLQTEKDAIHLSLKVLQISKELDAYTGFRSVVCVVKPGSCRFIQ